MAVTLTRRPAASAALCAFLFLGGAYVAVKARPQSAREDTAVARCADWWLVRSIRWRDVMRGTVVSTLRRTRPPVRACFP